MKSGEKTCILCTSDNYTTKCLSLLGSRLRPEGKIGLHGFDHVKTLSTLFPSLASVAYPSDEIGKAAFRLILSGDDSDILFPHELIGGESI